MLFKAYLCFSTGITVVRKESHSSRKSSRVSCCDEIQRTPISNKSNSMGVVNKGFRVSELDMYSDESNDASHVNKKHAPIIDVPVVSVEAKDGRLPETKANGKPSIYLGDTDCGFNLFRSADPNRLFNVIKVTNEELFLIRTRSTK